jgi:hypothetical protein
MVAHGKIVFLACLLVLGPLSGSTRAQEGAPTAPSVDTSLSPIEQLIVKLKEAPPYRASSQRQLVVNMGA